MKQIVFLLSLTVLTGPFCNSYGQSINACNLQKSNLLTGIMPEPQEVFTPAASANPFQFTKDTAILIENEADMVGAELLAADINDRLGFKIAIIKGLTRSAKSYVLIGRSDAAHQLIYKNNILNELGKTRPEGYRLLVDANYIIIEGHDERGALYGVQTLRQLVMRDGTVTSIIIRDWPQMQWRVSYAGLIDSAGISEHIKRCARIKINTIVLETYWNGPQNWWYSPNPEVQAKAKAFFDECKKYKIEPVPLVQGFGWGYGVTDLDPMASEGQWGEEEVVLNLNAPVKLKRANVIYTESAPVVVRDINSKMIYKIGKDYTILDGITVRPFRSDNKPYSIQALKTGSIRDGQQVIVGYNAVSPGEHKSYCPAEPRTYNIVDKTIDHVMQTYKPRIIHIGHDELFNSMTDSRCIKAGLTKEQLVLQDVMHWYNRIKSHDSSTQVMMWYDFMRTDGPKGALISAMDKLPKDLIICPWVYGVSRSDPDYIKKNVSLEIQNGFRIIGTPSGYYMMNSLHWYDALKPELSPNGKALGMMFSYWGDGELLQSCLPASAELMWSGNRIDRGLYKKYAQVNDNLKANGLALTFDLKKQCDAVIKYYNKKIISGASPDEIRRNFEQDIVTDVKFFEGVYGKKAWELFQYGLFPEQPVVTLRKLNSFLNCLSLYSQADFDKSEGQNEQACAKLQEIINVLEGISFLGKAQTQKLRSDAAKSFLISEAVFGTTVNAYRGKVNRGIIVTVVNKDIIKKKQDKDFEQLVFSRPIALNRIEGKNLAAKAISLVSPTGKCDRLKLNSDIFFGEGKYVSAINFYPQFDESTTIYEQRKNASISCYPAKIAPVIDGNLLDACWTDADSATGFLTVESNQAFLQTKAYALYDKQNIYIGFESEMEPGSILKTDVLLNDENVYEDESVQIFIDVNQDRTNYYQLIVNTAGIVQDRSSTDGETWNSNAKVACSRSRDKWNAELAIPLASLTRNTDLARCKWGINFCRSTNAQNKPRVDSTWAELSPGAGFFFLQPAKFGTIEFRTSVPKRINKILVLGNSLTCHGPSTEALGWSGSWGMAATEESKDYVHTFYRLLSQEQPQYCADLKVGSLFEGRLREYDFSEWLNYRPDIVIIQTGDNVPADKINSDFGELYSQTVAKFKTACNPIILCTSVWSDANAAQNAYIKEACRQNGAFFVDLSGIAADPQNRAQAEHHFIHPGVNWHPGNRGMQQIADAIWSIVRSKMLNN